MKKNELGYITELEPGKGTVDYDLNHEAWKTIWDNRCYIQRKILKPNSITYPFKYLCNLPCIIKIEDRFEKGENKGKLMYPALYVLREHMILNKERRHIQAKKCDGYIIKIRELEKYKPFHKLV